MILYRWLLGWFALCSFGLYEIEAMSRKGNLHKQGEEDHLKTHIKSSTDTIKRFRRQLSSRYAKLLFINLSGREVYIIYMDYYRNPVRFMHLRRNEKRALTTRIHTTWYAYDAVGREYMEINGKYNHLVRRSQGGQTSDLFIRSKDGKTADPPKTKVSEKYLEVMVIADSTIYKKHGNKTKKYLLTIMNAAKQHFYHKTFVFKMHLVVVRLLIIKDKRNDFKISEKNERSSLRSACNYAAALNYPSETDERHFDFAVLFTRRRFGHTGFTPLFQMCNMRHACTLVLDSGLSLAHVVAHEIAHSLGVEHDGFYNDCRLDGLKGGVMGKVLWSRFDNYYWSKCSQRQLNMTVDYFYCLNDKPVVNISDYMVSLPGVYMNRDEQCQIAFYDHYGRCNAPYRYYECKHLYCTPVGSDMDRDCSLYTRPPLEGSSCNDGRGWCVTGRCYPTGRLLPAPIHGRWSSWGSWSRCSVECGIGIRSRERSCDRPRPKYGGRKCPGQDTELKSCKKRDCEVPKTYIDERNLHCKNMYGADWIWLSKQRTVELASTLHGLNCSFERNCSWIQFDKDDFDWTRASGKTPSQGTGPSDDHTFGNKTGYYMFIEASDGDGDERRKKGYKARLLSPIIKVPQLCLSFYYHMLGSHLGSLNVYKFDSKAGVLLWNETEDLGDRWNFVEIDIESSRAFEIHILAVRGSHYQGDIAIDDIRVVFGRCGKTENVLDRGPCTIACTDRTETMFKVNQTLPDSYECVSANRTQNCTDSKCEWCIKGNCFPYGLLNYAPIHGGWSAWSSWGPCSSTCGLGIKSRQRRCDNPRPKYDGDECRGEIKDIMTCQAKECNIKATFSQKRNDYCSSLKNGEWIWFTKERAIDRVISMHGLNCTFENNCSWTQDTNDDFDWTRHKGKTPSAGTGPTTDHTYGNASGHYLFIEASTGEGNAKREKGYKARLISPIINVPYVCMSFYYHMHGKHLGSLSVFKLDSKKALLVWEETRDVGNQWKRVELSINGSRSFEIHIEAVRGVHYEGDIAIDDVTVNLGNCKKEENFMDPESCAITCSDPSGTQFLLNRTLPDAYTCQRDSHGNDVSNGICINGRCEKLKCTPETGAKYSLDECRVCRSGDRNC
ncbi:MAM and LDL-receptor class A domain-containing protein 2-like [Rhopilema esculentum]|uniref:MAM and LDL-receptor class A domain-containing protein 2-like n=1 Tax=Rhopilema esculentum TaxID=499914 RepID=UPI0031E1D1F2